MTSVLSERSAPPGDGLSVPELFLMTIDNGHKQGQRRAQMVVEFLRVQDELALACTSCQATVPVKIFTVADAEQLCGLAGRDRSEAVREEIVDQYGEYIATCPRCLRRSLLPLRVPSVGIVLPDGKAADGVPAAGEAA